VSRGTYTSSEGFKKLRHDESYLNAKFSCYSLGVLKLKGCSSPNGRPETTEVASQRLHTYN
jgi:hypothetical protein